MKVSVHLTFYLDDLKNSKKLINFKKILKSFLSISKNTFIFVHTNQKKIMLPFNNVKKIYHNLDNDNPLRLTWKSRELIYKQRNNFDYFIYAEDDCFFTKKNFKYWLKYSKILTKYNLNTGFIRTEISPKRKQIWTVDLYEKLYRHIYIKGKKYIVLNNPYFAMWIMDKRLLNKFIKSKFWDLKNWRGLNSFTKLYDREKSAVGWHGLNMDKFDATVVPYINNKILNDCFFPHQSNKYVAERDRYHISKKNILEKKTLPFFKLKTNKIELFVKEAINFLYLKLRFNFKNIYKN